jgi:hypothetical protein
MDAFAHMRLDGWNQRIRVARKNHLEARGMELEAL